MDVPALQLEPDQWQELGRLIDAGRILPAMVLLREATGCTIPVDIEWLSSRFEELRSTDAERFEVDLATYWDGFCS